MGQCSNEAYSSHVHGSDKVDIAGSVPLHFRPCMNIRLLLDNVPSNSKVQTRMAFFNEASLHTNAPQRGCSQRLLFILHSLCCQNIHAHKHKIRTLSFHCTERKNLRTRRWGWPASRLHRSAEDHGHSPELARPAPHDPHARQLLESSKMDAQMEMCCVCLFRLQ